MSSYLVVDITVHDTERYKEYVQLVPPLIAKHRGTYLVRGGKTETLEGDWSPQRLVVLAFPDAAHARAFVNDPEYLPVAAIRQAASTTHLLLAEGYDPE